jgi:hypothetical protein
VPLKRQKTSTRLHNIISQKIVFLIVTAVIVSDLTMYVRRGSHGDELTLFCEVAFGMADICQRFRKTHLARYTA